jgi:ribosomal protein S13
MRFTASFIETAQIESPYFNYWSDAESKFALGHRLDIATVDIYALELIPGISDTLAFKMIAKRSDISETAQYLSQSARHRSLEIIHGIGKKTAQKLATYLEVNSGSSLANTSSAEISRIQSRSSPGHSRRKQGEQPISALTAKSSIPKGATRRGSVGPKSVT